MQLDKEHDELMAHFERQHKNCRLDKEDRALWPRGVIYQDGKLNELFLSYRQGYALGAFIYGVSAESGAHHSQGDSMTQAQQNFIGRTALEELRRAIDAALAQEVKE